MTEIHDCRFFTSWHFIRNDKMTKDCHAEICIERSESARNDNISMFIPISELLKRSLSSANIIEKVEDALILERFNVLVVELYGEDTSQQVKARSFKNGVLTVSSVSSSASQEIFTNHVSLIKALNKKIGKVVVERISFN